MKSLWRPDWTRTKRPSRKAIVQCAYQLWPSTLPSQYPQALPYKFKMNQEGSEIGNHGKHTYPQIASMNVQRVGCEKRAFERPTTFQTSEARAFRKYRVNQHQMLQIPQVWWNGDIQRNKLTSKMHPKIHWKSKWYHREESKNECWNQLKSFQRHHCKFAKFVKRMFSKNQPRKTSAATVSKICCKKFVQGSFSKRSDPSKIPTHPPNTRNRTDTQGGPSEACAITRVRRAGA